MSNDILLLFVRYGDRAPMSFITRLVSIAWTVIGLVMLSIFMGMVTTALTVVTQEINQEAALYGANVSFFIGVQLSCMYMINVHYILCTHL